MDVHIHMIIAVSVLMGGESVLLGGESRPTKSIVQNKDCCCAVTHRRCVAVCVHT